MYRQNTSARGQRNQCRTRQSGQRGGAGKKGEQVHLKQLCICLMLFFTVFIGKGVFPAQVQEMSGVLLEHLGRNTDFRGALIQLGESISQEPELWGEIGEFCLEVFGVEEEAVQVSLPVSMESLSEAERRFLNSDPDKTAAAAHYLRLEQIPREWLESAGTEGGELSGDTGSAREPKAEQPTLELQMREEVHSAAQVGTILLQAEEQEREPPDGHTMDQLSLGNLQVCTPVMGTLWSEYGYRDHPVDGEYKFHSGVDIGADLGTPIGAFADGQVEYTGLSEIYGNYLQLDHGQGIKSFYAHCQSIEVTQGQQVQMGEEIARVGSTGTATGPHLHLELKCAGMRIDPAYYIQYRRP